MRVILHGDANGFYAACELVYRPELRGLPMSVGGDVEARHGIVLASTPEASPRPAEPVLASAEDGLVRIGPESGEDLYLCAGHIAFDDGNAALLTDLLQKLGFQ